MFPNLSVAIEIAKRRPSGFPDGLFNVTPVSIPRKENGSHNGPVAFLD